jgi:hypothetical protein
MLLLCRYDSVVARSPESLWLGACAGLGAAAAALAGANVTLDSVRSHYPFWTSGIMVAVYVTGALAVMCYGGAVREWPIPLTGGRGRKTRAEDTGATSPGIATFSGDAYASAADAGVAIGQAGSVHVGRDPAGPHRPGRPSR